MFEKHYWSIDLKNIHPGTVLHASKKDCECQFLFPFKSTDCTYIHEDRGEKIRMKLCFILSMNQPTVYILLWFFQRDQWDASSPMHTVIQSQQFSISIPTYQLEMFHMFTKPHCTQVNLHKKKTTKNNYKLDVLW